MKIGALSDYAILYKDVFTLDHCNKAIKEVENSRWSKHTYYNPHSGTSSSYENDLSVSDVVGPLGKEIQDKLWDVIDAYIRKDMAEMSRWFSSWNGYSQLRFNKYDETTEMRIHCDHIYSLFDGQRKGVPVLTVLGALNEEYEGGEFVMFEDKIIDMPAGSVLVFPSNFLYPHEVKPIKSGVRYSFVSWVW